MSKRDVAHHVSLAKLQTMLGVSRGVVDGLIDLGLVTPTRGPRNALRFSFQDVVLLRTALQLRTSNASPRKLREALARLRRELPDELPLSGIRVAAEGNDIVVKTGASRWDAVSGQMLLDFEVAEVAGDVVLLEATPERKSVAVSQAKQQYDLAESLRATDPSAAVRVYRRAIELSPEPFYAAYVDLGALLCEQEHQCGDALRVFDEALALFPRDAVLHFNRGVALDIMERLDEAKTSYEECLALNPEYADAHHNLAILLDRRGDRRGLIRHLNAYRKLSG
ncbi:tetratricopeptide repeat protein [Caballeronia sp. LZ035]|uniref:tetratricopeptide repeat protein n=1 Tax=Caballeronia sp. LZ035 TaxID=3038568 RepID=UPI00285A3C3D|nr:tetratricopeptide repeat protein [Caballeronia sp. LZ035]MDR5763243.1 tetratricopeptide repeat protein [Caballeronia sp. LZ035]